MATSKPIITEYHSKNVEKPASDKWYTSDEETAHEVLFSTIKHIDANQITTKDYLLTYARMYSNKEIQGLSPNEYSKITARNSTLTYNVVKSCVDTVISKIAKSKPKPQFLTEDGDHNLKRKAKLLTQYIEGQFEALQIYKKGAAAAKDAAVFGTGCLHFYIDSDYSIKAEKVFIDELIVDDLSSMYGTPPELSRRKYISKDNLIAMFPKFKSDIQNAQTTSEGQYRTGTANNIEVIESWRLPSSSAKDGKHIIAYNGKTLLLEDYTKDHFPFEFINWTDSLRGFWGIGLSEELLPIQRQMDVIARQIVKAQSLIATPRIFIENHANVPNQIITNKIGEIVKYTGSKPEFSTPQAIGSDIYTFLESLYNKAFEICGISRLSAQAQKPGGLDSAVALREYQDIESERFMLFGQAYEDLFMRSTKQVIELSKEADELRKKDPKSSKLQVKVKTNSFIKKIKWKDVDMDEDQYEMQVFPVSQLPSTPAGKIATVQELIQAGMIDQDQGLSLLNFPDLDSFMNLRNAAKDNIERILGVMTEEGRYIAPEPFMNLKLAQTLAQETYLRCQIDNLPEDKLELLRAFMADIQTLLIPPTPPLAPPVDAAAMPLANPAAPPVSDLLPALPNSAGN